MQLLLNEKNSGNPFLQWRRGAQMASGKYLWIAESDDFADPRLLATLLAQMRCRSQVGLAYCQSNYVNDLGQVIGSWLYYTDDVDRKRWKKGFVNDGTNEVSHFLVQRNTIPNASAVLVKRGLFLAASDGAELHRLSGDWWTWARVLLNSDIAFVAEPLNYFRSHSLSVRGTTKLAAGCIEDLNVKCYICSQVFVPSGIRYRALKDSVARLWECIGSPSLVLAEGWFEEIQRQAKMLHWSAPFWLLWLKAKRRLKRFKVLVYFARFVTGTRCRIS